MIFYKNITPEKNEIYFSIVDAICYWLGYQFKIGRSQLIHEASLRYPIADSITAKGVSIHSLVLEQLHPIFKSKKIDLVLLEEGVKSNEKGDDNIKAVFEFKLAKNSTSIKFKEEHQRVFDDIVRLAYYNLYFKKDCYFLMCGEYDEFKTYFVGQKHEVIYKEGKNSVIARNKNHNYQNNTDQSNEWKPDGLYKDWFNFKLNENKEFVINKKDHDSWGLKVFQENYHIREKVLLKYSDHMKIRTTCLAITPPGLENIKTHAAGLWKIEAV